MDIDADDPEAVPAEDPLMIDGSLPAVTADGEPGPGQSVSSGPVAAAGLDADPLAGKRYHNLEPRTTSKAATSLLAVKQEACLSLPQTAPAAAPTSRCVTTRRSRRLSVETVPFKKRKRIISPAEVDQEEYILPDHVQHQVEQAAQQTGGRRPRSKRTAKLAAPMEINTRPPEHRDADLDIGNPKTILKQEPSTGDGPASEGKTETSVALLPSKKRGRPRKSQAPQRCAPAAEEDVTAAGDGDSGARQSPPQEQKEEPPQPRRGRKSTAPSRRRRPPPQPPALVDIVSPPPAQDAEDTSSPQRRPASPPATNVSRVICASLPVSQPVALTDQLRLLEVPSKRRQRPCPFCGSLTGCPPPDSAEKHDHATETALSPRRHLRVIVDGTAPSDCDGKRRPISLGDQDTARAAEITFRRRCRRRPVTQSASQSATRASNTLECGLCGKVMLSISRLKKHQLVHTDERPFHCDKCPKSFKSIHVLNAHQLTHINYRPFRCDLCQQTFAKKWTLRGHMVTHDRCDGTDGLTCKSCSCEFLDRSTFESHMKIHTGERKWECKVCHRGFAKKLKLRKHMVVHSQAMLHKCHLCDREFRWKEKLVKHVMLHTGERPFKCGEPRCTKSFRAHSDLNVHLRNVHKKQPKKLDYPIVKSDPKPNHCELLLMRVNEMDGIPTCDLCTETFTSKDHYLNHVIPAHRDQEAYVCHPCKRVFDDRQIYDDHQDERHRRGEIMWRCQLCPKIFSKRSLFEGHKTLHATKFQCKICFRFASDEKRLQSHIIGHQYTDIDNSSHACTICSRQFKLRFSLKNHMFKMHSIDLPSLRKPPMRKFECSICHARFVRPTPAYNHMVRVHNIKPEPEVQDMFDLTTLSSEHPQPAQGPVLPGSEQPDDQISIADLQKNLRMKVQAMAAQGMWDASEADGSTYLGGSAARRRQTARLSTREVASDGAAPPPPPPPQLPVSQQQQQQLGIQQQPQAQQNKTPPPPAGDDCGKTLLHLSPGKRGQLVRVTGSPLPMPPPGVTPFVTPGVTPGVNAVVTPGVTPGVTPVTPGVTPVISDVTSAVPPGITPDVTPGITPGITAVTPGITLGATPGDSAQRQQIIVIQQEGEDEIDLSRVLGGAAPADAQTLTMNADGVLVDDQGNPVSLMVEGGGTATHLLEYLRVSEPPVSAATAGARPAV